MGEGKRRSDGRKCVLATVSNSYGDDVVWEALLRLREVICILLSDLHTSGATSPCTVVPQASLLPSSQEDLGNQEAGSKHQEQKTGQQ